MYTESLQLWANGLAEEEAKKLLVQAMFHLRCVSGSRNSFEPPVHPNKFPKRSPGVERMHYNAYLFLRKYDKYDM